MLEENPSERWFEEHLSKSAKLYPERLGKKRKIYGVKYDLPLAALLIQPAAGGEENKMWKFSGSLGPVASLFELLRGIAEREHALVLYATNPDGAYVVLHWKHAFSATFWSPSILTVFQTIPSEEGGEQYLILLFRERKGAVVFTLYKGLEIAFYGEDNLWKEISTILYS